MPNVDSLNISISATAQKASNSLDVLIGKFSQLSSALTTIQGKDMSGFAAGMQQFSNAMQGMQSVDKSAFSTLASGIKKFQKLDPTTIQSSSVALKNLGSAFESMTNTNFLGGAKQISEVASAIKQLGYKSSTQAIENIPKLATAMKQLMTELSKAPRVSQNLIDMTNALGNLARTGSSSGRAYTSLSKSMNLFSGSTKTAKKHSFSLAGAIGKVYATYWLLFRAVGKVKDAIDISSQLTEVQNVVNATFGNYRNLIEEFSNTSIVDFGMSELTAKKVSSRFQSMGTAMGFSQGKMADMSIELTKLTADMASFYNLEQEDVAEDLQSVFTGQTRPLRQYGLDLTEATLKEWALKNGMDANIKSMSQAEKTLLRYNYVLANTGAAQGDFKKTQMTWANQTRILSENFKALASVIGGTFINALKPMVVALNSAMGALISFAKTVSESLGKIFGWKYEDGSGGIANDYEDAADSAGDIADSTGAAANNIKKMKAGLRAFDELKTINLPDNNSVTGGSGGNTGGSGGSASGSGGQWTKVDSIFKDYESSLDNLYKLGDYIGTTLTNALNDIPWNEVYEGARNFGTGLASFLNGLISPELFGAVGTTIANSLNTVITASLSFAETFDFKDFGESLATGINNFFKDFDFKKLAKSLNTWVDGLKDTIAGFVGTLSWEDIISGIGDFLGELELDTISLVGMAFAFKWGTGITKDIIMKEIGSALATTIGGSFTVGGGLTLALGITALAGFTIQTTRENEALGDEFWAEQLQGNETSSGTPVPSVDSTLALIKGKMTELQTWWGENSKLSYPILTNSGAPVPDETSVFNLMTTVQEKWNQLKTWWDTYGKLSVSILIGDIKEYLKEKWGAAKKWWDEKKESLSKIIPSISDIKEKLKEKWDTARTWWKDKKTSLTKIVPSITDIKENLKKAWKKAKTWWKDNVKLSIPKLNFHVEYKKASGAIQTAIVKALNLDGWPSLQFFASGGFPEDGTFRASHGEIMGRFDNGKSVVANNKQITDGISAAVYQGNRENNALLRQEIQLLQAQNELLSRILEKDTGISANDLFNSVRKSSREYFNRTGNPAFVY